MKKMMIWMLIMVMAAGIFAGFSYAEESGQEYSDSPLITVDASEKDDAYYQELLDACIYNNKVVRNYPFTWEDEAWHDYRKALNKALKVETIDDDAKAVLDAAAEALEAMPQVEPVADHTWLIWGDSMPSLNDPATFEYTFDTWDVPEFKPFLIPYILEDQTDVKGNIIMISGGAYTHRANDAAGYVIAPFFNEQGYNVFVLQRRVDPYAPEDCWMDLQRSIRYIRAHSEELGLGSDYMILDGYSGGASTIVGTIQYLYGDIQPTIYDETYVPDEIDAINSDVDAAFIKYPGPVYFAENEDGTHFSLDNPNLPALFIAVGANDSEDIYNASFLLAQEANCKTMVDFHVFGNVGHSFGKGLSKSNSVFWVEMANNFVEIDKMNK